jgi:hypothetical protein
MRMVFVLCLLLLSSGARAGYSILVVAHGVGDVPVASSIDLEADYVAVSVTLRSSADDPVQRSILIQRLQSAVRKAALADPDMRYQQGEISLSAAKGKAKFSLSSGGWSSSSSHFFLLSRLGKEKDMYSATEKILRLVKGIRRPEDTELVLGDTALAIDSPEKYRPQLLKKVGNEIRQAKRILGSGYKAAVTGLENPVKVTQKNDHQVTVYFDYSVQFSQ